MSLYRGNYRLAHMSQVLGRDECAQEIARHPGKKAHGYMLTDEQVKDSEEGRHPSLPYRFLVRSLSSAALAWKAFYTRGDLQVWIDAYGLELDREPSPGQSFQVLVTDRPMLAIVEESRANLRTYSGKHYVEVDTGSGVDARERARPFGHLASEAPGVDCGDYHRVALDSAFSTTKV